MRKLLIVLVFFVFMAGCSDGKKANDDNDSSVSDDTTADMHNDEYIADDETDEMIDETTDDATDDTNNETVDETDENSELTDDSEAETPDTSEPDEESDDDAVEDPEEFSVNGFVQKGPFIKDSEVQITELDENFEMIPGTSFITKTIDDLGNFNIKRKFKSRYIEIKATGYYFNEVTGDVSASSINAYVFADLMSLKGNAHINILTTLERKRVQYLMKQGWEFEDAMAKAEREILDAFGIFGEDSSSFQEMDILQPGSSNAMLLAISARLQGGNTPGALSSLVADIIYDIEKDGTIDDPKITAKINAGGVAISSKLFDIRDNLEDSYSFLTDVNIGNFEDYCDDDGDSIINKLDFNLLFSHIKNAEFDTIYESEEEHEIIVPATITAKAEIISGSGIIMKNGVDSGTGPVSIFDGDKIKLAQISGSAQQVTANTTVSITYLGQIINGTFSVTTHYCGDALLHIGTEFCDDGDVNNCNECQNNCQEHLEECGNGCIDGDEKCDHGELNGDCGTCKSDCKIKPANFCGDGFTCESESCDDGLHNGEYNKCKSDCTGIGLHCGDGIFTPGSEVCDGGTALCSVVDPSSYIEGTAECGVSCMWDVSECVSFPHETIVWGSELDDGGEDIVVDSMGSVIVGGYTNGSFFGATALGGVDGFATKWTQQLTMSWNSIVGTVGNETIDLMALDSSENIRAFGKNVSYGHIYTSSGSFSGNVGEIEIPNAPYTTTGKRVSVDLSGNIIVVGVTTIFLGHNQVRLQDVFISKFNSNGEKLWTKTWGTEKNDDLSDMAVDGEGNIYITGNTEGSVTGYPNSGYNDFFVAKFDSDGSLLWERMWGTTGCDNSYALTVDNTENIYIVGDTDGALDGNFNEGFVDAFLIKINSSGQKQWTRQWGTDIHDSASSVDIDSNGDVFVFGNTGGSIDGNQNACIYLGDPCSMDIFISKFNSSGQKQWTWQWGTEGFERGVSISVAESGNIYVSGMIMGAFNDDVCIKSEEQEYCLDDGFLTKLFPDGNHAWTKQIGTVGSDQIGDMVIDSSENIYLTGFSDWWSEDYTSYWRQMFFYKIDTNENVVKERIWSDNFGNGVHIDSSHNIYLTGAAPANFDGNNGAAGVFLSKLFSDATVNWIRQWGVTPKLLYKDIIINESEMYMTGAVNYALDNIAYGGYDIFLGSKQIGSSGDDEGNAIVMDSVGSFYVAGYASGDIEGQNG
jgi:hypothetical protein